MFMYFDIHLNIALRKQHTTFVFCFLSKQYTTYILEIETKMDLAGVVVPQLELDLSNCIQYNSITCGIRSRMPHSLFSILCRTRQERDINRKEINFKPSKQETCKRPQRRSSSEVEDDRQ